MNTQDGNYNVDGGHSMETDHDALDLLDMSEWQNEHAHDPFAAGNVFGESPHHHMSNDYDSVNNPNAPFPGSGGGSGKKPVIPTITTIYEPKFFEIFQAYNNHCLTYEPLIKNQNIAGAHLMTLCLNNLLPFSNWARESENALFIRVSLFENPDMRPEVRNGLAMIIVYVFSAAKANEMRLTNPALYSSADMFTVLMKTDTGFGIVNKTSLKIYSDPYGFFNFLKTCLSGLIDASAIPENERLSNQQTKRTRRGSKNKDEVDCYDYLKTSLTALFEVPENLQLAKNRILQILNFWHVKGKSIRTERFSSIYSIMPTLGNNPPSDPNQQQLTMMSSPSQAGAGSLANYMDNDSMTIDSSVTPTYASQSGQGQPVRHQRISGRSSVGSVDGQQYLSNLAAGQGLGGYGPGQGQGQGSQQAWENESTYSDSKSSSPHPSFYDGGTSARSSGFSNPNTRLGLLQIDRTSSREERDSSSNQFMTGSGMLPGVVSSGSGVAGTATGQQMLSLLQNRIISIPVPTLRFDRLGSLTWTGTNTFLYDFDELQRTTHHLTFYLIDELKLKAFFLNFLNKTRIPEDEFDFNGIFRFVIPDHAVTMGLTSIDRILHKSGAIITTWNQLDFPQMKLFINGWKAQSIPNYAKQLANVPEPPMEPMLSPTHSDSFNIGSSPVDPTKRLSKRRSSGSLDPKTGAQTLKSIHDMANLRLGITPPPPNAPMPPTVSNSTSRGQSLISVKSELSPVGNETRMAPSLDLPPTSSVPALSLIDYWYLLRNANLGMDNVNNPRTNFGRGIIAFERSTEVGLIIRANQKFNIPEDIWCLFYLEDAVNYMLEQIRRTASSNNPIDANNQASASLQMSFGAFLCTLLPQTRALFQYLQHEQAYQQVNMRQQQQNMVGGHMPFSFNSMQSGIAISYYSHRTEGMNSSNPLQSISETGPPVALNNSQYRTIGTLDQNFQQILSRFSNDCYFHDIVLL